MKNPISNLSLAQLKQALTLKEQIESLEQELSGVLGGVPAPVAVAAPAAAPTPRKKPVISAAGRARIAAAQRARWAQQKKAKALPAATKPASVPKPPTPSKSAKGVISAAGRARLSALAKARWAKARKAGKTSLS